MNLNWKEIDLLLNELSLENRLLQKIIQPNYYSLVLTLYKPGETKRLLINLRQSKTGLYYIDRIKNELVKLQRFAQLLRSKLSGLRIIKAKQIKRERIICIDFGKKETFFKLYIILWGNTTNAILCDTDQTIIDSFYRRPNRGHKSGSGFYPEDEFINKEYSEDDYSVREYPKELTFSQFIASQIESEIQKIELQNIKEKAEKTYNIESSAIISNLENMEKKITEYLDCERYKQFADIILAEQYKIKKDDRKLQTGNFYGDNKPVIIELDPKKTPQQNAENYYSKYKKSKSGYGALTKRLAAAKLKLSEIDKTYGLISNSESVEDFKSFISKFKKVSGNIQNDNSPGLRLESEGFTILVGRTAKENDELLRKFVKGNDFWLHARDYPGAYIFIKFKPGFTVPLSVLTDAGSLALHFCKAKNISSGDLFYTRVKYLRRAKHGIMGTVIPTQEKNLFVKIDKRRIEELLGKP